MWSRLILDSDIETMVICMDGVLPTLRHTTLLLKSDGVLAEHATCYVNLSGHMGTWAHRHMGT